VESPDARYYFASFYHSWHGSPSRQDSEIPLIVAHPQLEADGIGRVVATALGPRPAQQGLTDVLLTLRDPGSTGRATVGARRP
jgi:hypothetical protein